MILKNICNNHRPSHSGKHANYQFRQGFSAISDKPYLAIKSAMSLQALIRNPLYGDSFQEIPRQARDDSIICLNLIF